MEKGALQYKTKKESKEKVKVREILQGKSMLATIKRTNQEEGEFGDYPEAASDVWPYVTLHTDNNVKKTKCFF